MSTLSPDTVGSSDSGSEYFDLHILGLGYVNRIREVFPKPGKKGDPFLACTIAALNGPRNEVAYRYYDVRVSGKDAQHLIRKCMPASDADKKILIGFCLGDPWTDIFAYPAGHAKAGQTGVSEKARLLFVSWIKIDGVQVYRAKRHASDAVGSDAAAETAPATDAPDSSEGSPFAA